MKLFIEIKDGECIYSYEICDEKVSHTCDVTSQWMIMFIDILKKMSETFGRHLDNKYNKFNADLWAEKNGYEFVKREKIK
jgi:hypothetical protein